MTAREQMIDEARRAILERRGPGKHRGAGLDAEAVVDALLPQVSTVEELTALPDGTVVVRTDGMTHRVTHDRRIGYYALHSASPGGGPYVTNLQRVLDHFGPLTVVWRPRP